MGDPSRWSDPHGGAPHEIQRLLAAARGGPPPLPEAVRSASAIALTKLGGAAAATGWWTALKVAAALSVTGALGVSMAHRNAPASPAARPPSPRLVARPPSTSAPGAQFQVIAPENGAPLPVVVDVVRAPVESVASRAARAHPSVASDIRVDREAEAAMLERARQLLTTGETALSLGILRDHLRRFPRSALAEERDYLMFRALIRDASRVGVEREASRFLRRYPAGIYSSQVRSMLGTQE